MLPSPPEMVQIVIAGSQVIQIPKRFARYVYVKTLGCGCTSAVVLLRNIFQSTLFACKIVSRQHLVNENIFDRFEQEVRLLPSLVHPNIVHFEEILFDPELIFVVMEYCSQGDLFSHIVANGVFPESRARDILRQIAEAIRYIHDRDIAHRDLKPENILLDRQFTAKLADFGLCHVTSSRGLLKTPCGSPFYAPPEIISNVDYDGKSADIWSLGVMLFTMVTGSLPWSSDNQSELFRQIKAGDIEIPPTLSQGLQDLLGKMLQKDPARRLTIGEVLGSSWFPRQQNGQSRRCMRSSTWLLGGDDFLPPEEPQAPMSMPSGPRRLLVRPRKKASASMRASHDAASQGLFPFTQKASLTSTGSWK
jgi:serine/threonine protein kinase